MRKKVQKPLTLWGKEIREIIEASQYTEASFAEKILGRRKSWLHYQLRSKTVKGEIVDKINHALASALGVPDVSAYLGIVAMLDRPKKGRLVPDHVFETPYTDLLNVVKEKLLLELDFSPGYKEYIVQALSEMRKTHDGKHHVIDLALELYKGIYKNKLRHVNGNILEQSMASLVMDVFNRYGINLKPWMRSDEEPCFSRAHAGFHITVSKALAKKNENGVFLLSLKDRNEMETDILSASREPIAALFAEIDVILKERLAKLIADLRSPTSPLHLKILSAFESSRSSTSVAHDG